MNNDLHFVVWWKYPTIDREKPSLIVKERTLELPRKTSGNMTRFKPFAMNTYYVVFSYQRIILSRFYWHEFFFLHGHVKLAMQWVERNLHWRRETIHRKTSVVNDKWKYPQKARIVRIFLEVLSHPNVNIALSLSREGRARRSDWRLPFLTRDVRESFSATERSTKESRFKLWSTFVSSQRKNY